MKFSLNGQWTLSDINEPDKLCIPVNVPGSLYSAMLREGLMDDPYYRENEYISTDISDRDIAFERSFDADEELFSSDRVLLKFYGIDTLAEIVLNGNVIGTAENMHREYVFDVTDIIMPVGNVLRVNIFSPLKFIREKNEKEPLWGVASTVAGYPHIRKAHYMFGWDWGPKLPDMGIWRDVELIGVRGGVIDGVYVRQDHSRVDEGIVGLSIEVTAGRKCSEELSVKAFVTAPGGVEYEMSAEFGEERKVCLSCDIENAELWYPHNYGAQPLYALSVRLYDKGEEVDEHCENIGLRTVTVSRTPDSEGDGEEFAFVVNGIKIFAMGANYIPEDQIISRCSAKKTEKLLKQCVMANFNMIRVWGGGYYPEDYFYDACDRLGLLVWQDFMFACSVYRADVDFCSNVKNEVVDNIKRLRNHPSLAMWCGNNEIESMWQYWGIDADPEYKKDYLRLFEALIPKVLEFYDPVTFYHPSSPSSGGGFNDSGANNKGDQHYWAVWHSLKPFTDYYSYKFRFCSEYGFESIPSIRTVRKFAEEGDLNLMSPVMEAHQKCEDGNEKIMYYLAQMSHYPYTFEGLVYATQMVQSDAVRLNVEHMRRNRGVCMGSLYWQVNDSNPVISWSSVDYYHRWKALHYNARKFYAPVLISADGEDKDNIRLNVSSERQEEFSAVIRWRSRMNTGDVIAQGMENVIVKPLAAEDHIVLTPENTGISSDMRDKAYIEYTIMEKGIRLSSGTFMFVQPKSFRFLDPKLSVAAADMGNKFKIVVSANAFAKSVCLELLDGDCLFSDNWFDLHGDTAGVYVSKAKLPAGITPEELAGNIRTVSYFEALGLGK
ncbi:MAG: glycoside hydrolase family 2 protein [Oscillospiraceae bacterium]|nr:glycoside hydrolase family 2 protein [Oscillospiraceae bacterium]MDY6208673.1 glycoside hydrolase family 2 protein [Oscillospiraceae bacterium]